MWNCKEIVPGYSWVNNAIFFINGPAPYILKTKA